MFATLDSLNHRAKRPGVPVPGGGAGGGGGGPPKQKNKILLFSPPVCGLNRVYLEAGTRVFCYLIKNKERQLPNKPYVGFWVGKAGNLNNLNNLNIGVDPGEGVGPGI